MGKLKGSNFIHELRLTNAKCTNLLLVRIPFGWKGIQS